jgi:hypothetical protein
MSGRGESRPTPASRRIAAVQRFFERLRRTAEDTAEWDSGTDNTQSSG